MRDIWFRRSANRPKAARDAALPMSILRQGFATSSMATKWTATSNRKGRQAVLPELWLKRLSFCTHYGGEEFHGKL